MVHIDDTTAICATCGIRKSHSEFRRRRAGSEQRYTECRTCYNAEMREYRARRKEKKLVGIIRKLGRQRLRDHVMIADVVRDALARFGGTDAIARQWRRTYDAAHEAGDWSVCFSCLSALQNLVIACDASEPEYDDMVNEDLVRRVAADALERSPEIIEFYASSWGWTPPPDWQSNVAVAPEVTDR